MPWTQNALENLKVTLVAKVHIFHKQRSFGEHMMIRTGDWGKFFICPTWIAWTQTSLCIAFHICLSVIFIVFVSICIITCMNHLITTLFRFPTFFLIILSHKHVSPRYARYRIWLMLMPNYSICILVVHHSLFASYSLLSSIMHVQCCL